MTLSVTDVRGVSIPIEEPPARVVSLVPSITETLFAMELASRVAGVTRFCVPPFSEKVRRVGGVSDPDVDAIRDIAPDLVIASVSENRREDVEAIEREFPVFVVDPKTVFDATRLVMDLGAIMGAIEVADFIALSIILEVDAVTEATREFPPVPIAVPVWKDPWLFVGGETYCDSLLTVAGVVNYFSDRVGYVEADPESLVGVEHLRVLLPDEPFNFTAEHVEALRGMGLDAISADGKRLFWYGYHTLNAPKYLVKLLFPEHG